MPDPALGAWLPVAVVMVFALAWLGVCALLARAGGWAGLARTHRARHPAVGERFWFVSGSMAGGSLPVNYKRCLVVVVGRRGFQLSVLLPFRFRSPPLFLPWADVVSVVERPFRRTFGVAVRLRGSGPVISVRGRAAHRMRRAHAAFTSGRTDSAFGSTSLSTL